MTIYDPMSEEAHHPLVVRARVGEDVSGCLVGFSAQPHPWLVRSLVCVSRANRTFKVIEMSKAFAAHLLGSGQLDMTSLFDEWSGWRWVVAKALGTIASTAGSSSAAVPGTEARSKAIGWLQRWGAVPVEVCSAQADGSGTAGSPRCRSSRPAEPGVAARVPSFAGVVQAGGMPLARLVLSRRTVPDPRCQSWAKTSRLGLP
jgi:hypothetical protein